MLAVPRTEMPAGGLGEGGPAAHEMVELVEFMLSRGIVRRRGFDSRRRVWESYQLTQAAAVALEMAS
jgi:hypothetical protein